MINIVINDKAIAIAKDNSLLIALETAGYKNTSFAVAINRSFIPKSQYNNVFLQEGDQIEIVSPMQGG